MFCLETIIRFDFEQLLMLFFSFSCVREHYYIRSFGCQDCWEVSVRKAAQLSRNPLKLPQSKSRGVQNPAKVPGNFLSFPAQLSQQEVKRAVARRGKCILRPLASLAILFLTRCCCWRRLRTLALVAISAFSSWLFQKIFNEEKRGQFGLFCSCFLLMMQTCGGSSLFKGASYLVGLRSPLSFFIKMDYFGAKNSFYRKDIFLIGGA